MQNASIHVEVEKIGGSYPGSGDGTDQQLMNYVTFHQGTYLSYSTNDDDFHDFPEKMSKSAHRVHHELPTEILRTRDDYQSTLELARRQVITAPVGRFPADNGTREWTGYGSPENRDSALERWTFLASSAPDVPRRIKAQAHSCLAAGWFDRATEDPERWNIDSLYRAGNNANEAASLGLISPAVLRVGFSTESQGFRRPEDNRFPGLSTDRFERLADLWEAIDMRTAEVNRAKAKRDAKISRAPLKYVCSAEDCGIQATKKSGLLRCAGKCPVVFKPSYCSKECQKMVCCLSPSVGFRAQSCLLRRTGNGISRSVKLMPQNQACFLLTPTVMPSRAPCSGRPYLGTLTLTNSKDDPRDTVSTCQRGTGVPHDLIPRRWGRRR